MTTEIALGIAHLTDVSIIGRGGFSVVYAARHTLFKRRMAVKVLHPLTKDSERARFERECEVMGRLSDHPNVVSVYNAGYTDSDRPYLLMELVEGGSLHDRLERTGPLPWGEAIAHLLPICDALEHAHAQSILHRDIKPENILLTLDGRPRLADFGIASLRDATGATSTHITASMLHTAPETFENRRDERSDLYSLASTLFTLIVGRAPFWRPTDQSIHPLVNRLLNEPAPAIPPELAPPALSRLVQRCLAKDPNRRPQTAAELGLELRAIEGGPPAGSNPGREPAGVTPSQWDASRVDTGRPASAAPPGSGPQPFVPQHRPGASAPGWYHATGDPPGTQRFWTGTEWQGDPQPISRGSPGPPLASPERRIVARLIDWAIWVAMWLAVGVVLLGDSTEAASYLELLALGFVSTTLIATYEIVTTATLGATVGKLLLGLRVTSADGSEVGWSAAAMRMVLFIVLAVVSTAVFVPFVAMLVFAGLALGSLFSHPRRQTIWDRHAGTVVVAR